MNALAHEFPVFSLAWIFLCPHQTMKTPPSSVAAASSSPEQVPPWAVTTRREIPVVRLDDSGVVATDRSRSRRSDPRAE